MHLCDLLHLESVKTYWAGESSLFRLSFHGFIEFVSPTSLRVSWLTSFLPSLFILAFLAPDPTFLYVISLRKLAVCTLYVRFSTVGALIADYDIN